MFAHKHYVPILKTKAGERWAIDRLSAPTKSGLTPLFEIHSHKTKGDADHAADVCDALVNVWGTRARFFLDTVWLHEAEGDPATIQEVFEYARSVGLKAVPVVRATYAAATLDVIRDVMTADLRGCLIRYPAAVADGPPPTVLGRLVALLGTRPEDVDFLLDYRQHAMDLAADVSTLPTLARWRTFTAASGTFPRSLVALPLHAWNQVPRHDWSTWLAGVVGGALARRPAFGDYTVRDPGPPATFGDPAVSLRYTADGAWSTRVERKFRDGYADDMFDVCSSLVTRPEWAGTGFSVGDHTINEVALRNEGPGAPQQWLQWAMNHHMTHVVRQIITHPGL